MKRYLILLLSVMALCSCAEQDKRLYDSCKPLTRWWWFSSQIERSDVRDQLIWLKDHGFGGVEIAWVYPMFLNEDTPHPDFLSPEWREPVLYAKHVADSIGLTCDYTYGTLWPFNDVNLPAGDATRTYFDTVNVARRLRTWDHPREARILNHLDRNAFARYAERMDKGLGDAYKGTKSGVFVDSWEVKTAYIWTPGFGETFRKEHGYDIEPYMQEKTLRDSTNADIYYDYMKTLSGYVLEEFYKPFADNATSNGAYSRAQCAGAPTDLLTAYTLVDIPESEAILYEPSFSRIAASAATLSRKDAVSAETFTCAYGWTGLSHQGGRGRSPHQGEEQIADLKLICDALFANGVNQIIWHGFPFNKVGRSDNWFYTTCEISTNPERSLSGEPLTSFNRYMTKVSEYMRRGKSYSELAVYMPLEDSWMSGDYPAEVTAKMRWARGQYELRYITVPEEFKGMQPLWVNGKFLSDSNFREGRLYCGDASFSALYVDVDYMEYASLKDILKLAREGLPVYISHKPKEPGLNKHPDYGSVLQELFAIENVSSDKAVIPQPALVEGEKLPDMWCRQEGNDYYVFFANPLSSTIKYPLEYGYAFTDTGSTRQIRINHHGVSEPYTLVFPPTESLLLHISKAGIENIDLGYTPPAPRQS